MKLKNNMAEEKYVHSYKVIYEKEAKDGIIYLDSKLDREYAKVFFVYAKENGTAPFEDQDGKKYELSYEKEVYMLTRKGF
ncbi:MAG: hypothetical protein US57_C0002G0007 [Candidatus Moranbacteria bacterium GW2011_GWC2_37_73]|nr:MAG: hypothetical protein UR95_C0002G0105 [Parcubacteria group bacterium GW2011_GWC1_36_108]KKQ01052.1 MAG: hypothetical protein US09_C0003G0052 [Candidatus Moranbacteria bacterium GW2011_GWD1_36_198]KKQ02454.1 MAG: hypothetical protein US10_C0001G0052 [Candidatus Moranbacteria bacterium GW2011_GWD2_36_198]KKQ40300.1 MAG: hypothetical protein US57_C0002G0007 [Candidatus Moranbacteria bacterium GW2011_GWC2_37_73]HAS00267.1 hypothetical protein [Candidatus Moranbacteria bacterium]